jgi:hypothetical protein
MAYRAALEELTRGRVPLDWALTQNNIGRALLELGRRLKSVEHLQAAQSAFSGSRDVFQTTQTPYEEYFSSIIAETDTALEALQ